MAREITLYGPSGGRKQVRADSTLERQLREAGWAEGGHPPIAAPTTPPHIGASETARQAREALNVLPPEDWIKDWGYVLCAALDEAEHSRSWLVSRVDALAGIMIAGTDAMRAVADALTSWITRCRWVAGKPVLEPTPDRQRASEDLARAAFDAVTTLHRQTDLYIAKMGGGAELRRSAVAGDPAARARASQILAELVREIPAGVPEAQREKITLAVAKVRAALAGGTGVAGAEEDEEVPS